MTLTKTARLLFAFCFVAIFGCFLIESESQAQYFRRPPGQEVGRFLGLGYGNGYHCRTPGPQADYYNPYSAHNSYLVSRNQNVGRFSNMNTGYAVGGNFRGMGGGIPHSVYTGTKPDDFSVFESLPGNTVTPTFEPVNKQKSRFQRDLEERDFEDELDLDETEEDNDFRSRLEDEQDSAIDREEEDGGDFDTLRENFDSLDSEGEGSTLKGDGSTFKGDGSTLRDAFQPSEEDQAAFFGSNFGGN